MKMLVAHCIEVSETFNAFLNSLKSLQLQFLQRGKTKTIIDSSNHNRYRLSTMGLLGAFDTKFQKDNLQQSPRKSKQAVMKRKYYAVLKKDGSHALFDNWTDCERFVKGVSGVLHKSFKAKELAEAWLKSQSRSPLSLHTRQNGLPNTTLVKKPDTTKEEAPAQHPLPKELRDIEINEEFKAAIQEMETTSNHIFITGKAGTGKSTLLKYFHAKTKKKCVIVAPTGVAAITCRGQTIHSFFNIPPKIITPLIIEQEARVRSILRKVKTIIIDEISMVRADLFDGIDLVLKKAKKNDLPFGGVQMILFGDLAQLPPVVTRAEAPFLQSMYGTSPFFFNSLVLKTNPGILKKIRLTKVYRQRDRAFVDLLEKVRTNQMDVNALAMINSRVNPHFTYHPSLPYITLTATNSVADHINRYNLNRLPGDRAGFKAEITGSFKASDFPTEGELNLKTGAQVMFLRNDGEKRWANGTLGILQEIKEGAVTVRVTDKKGNPHNHLVEPETWENVRYAIDKKSGYPIAEVVGKFKQLPLKLAWAITIHKSQGKTLERIIIDIGRGAFAHGQIYVALSRCVDLQGIVLRSPVRHTDIIMDGAVGRFVGG